MMVYEIRYDEIVRVAKQQEAERGLFEGLGPGYEKAAQDRAVVRVGRFAYDPSVNQVTGPGEYMQERYDKRMERITNGRDSVYNAAMRQHGSPVLATLVSLQIDFAAWSGEKSFRRALEV